MLDAFSQFGTMVVFVHGVHRLSEEMKRGGGLKN